MRSHSATPFLPPHYGTKSHVNSLFKILNRKEGGGVPPQKKKSRNQIAAFTDSCMS